MLRGVGLVVTTVMAALMVVLGVMGPGAPVVVVGLELVVVAA